MPNILMDKKNRNIIAAVIFILMLAAAIFLYRPILPPFLWALIVAAGLNPLLRLIDKPLKNRTVSSLLVCLLVLVFLAVPVWQFAKVLANQSAHFAAKIETFVPAGDPAVLPEKVKKLENWVNIRTERLGLTVDALALFRGALVAASRTLADLPLLVKKVSLFLLDFFFFFVILFFLLRFGRELSGYFRELLPVDPERTNLFFGKFREMSAVSLLSSAVIALAQGSIGFVIYLILGVEDPVLWAVLTGLCSFIPLIGASVAWICVAILFLLSGLWIKALLMVLLGAGIISLSDNLIRPLIIRGKSNIHPVLLFFSIICGLRTMGFIGVFAGPLITVLVLTAVDLYHSSLNRGPQDPGTPSPPGRLQ